MTRITTHPGDILREDFMVPHGLSAGALARALDVPVNRMTDIIARIRPRAVTPDTAVRLSRYFGTTPQLWLNLQLAHDLSLATQKVGASIEATVRPKPETYP